jgi:hypothetical protein
MTDKLYSIDEIKRAISRSPKFKQHVVPDGNIDDLHEQDIETIEVKMFLYRLTGNKNEN